MLSRYLALLTVALIFGLFAVLIQWSALMFGDLAQVALRNGGALLLLLPILWLRQIPIRSLTRPELQWLFLYSIIIGASISLVTLALLAESVKTVLAVRYLIALAFAYVVSALLLKEDTGSVSFIALCLAMVGLVVFAWPFTDFFTPGVFHAIGAAILFGFSTLIIKKVSLKPEQIMLVEFSTITLLVGGFVLVTGAPVVTGFSWLSLFAMSVFSVLLVLVLYLIVYGFRETNYYVANIVLTSEIAFALLLGYVFLAQSLFSQELVGMSGIFLAAILPNLYGYWQSPQNRSLT